jgi:hypothetical protein
VVTTIQCHGHIQSMILPPISPDSTSDNLVWLYFIDEMAHICEDNLAKVTSFSRLRQFCYSAHLEFLSLRSAPCYRRLIIIKPRIQFCPVVKDPSTPIAKSMKWHRSFWTDLFSRLQLRQFFNFSVFVAIAPALRSRRSSVHGVFSGDLNKGCRGESGVK